MKKNLLAIGISAALMLVLSSCGSVPSANTPAAEPPVTVTDQASVQDTQSAPVSTEAPVAVSGRQDGERFETVIMLEGMEETVRYEHVKNDAFGFEMDYDYESLLRRSDGERECFISLWDDPEHPENYLEVRSDTGNAELVAEVIIANLSNEYEVNSEYRDLDHAGRCIYLEASVIKGTNQMPDQLQAVYIIPAPDGCRVATAHYSIEAAEGFGHRFAYMVNTMTVMERAEEHTLTDEQALAAIRQYCLSSNPDLEGIVNAGEYPVYWEIASSDANEIVVLYRSYTGTLVRYYIARATGETYVTEFVSGITPEEQRTEEHLNVWDYMT